MFDLEDTRSTDIPVARMDGLIVTESGDELIVYDRTNHHIHRLNHTTAVFWRSCDGHRSFTEFAQGARRRFGDTVTEDLVRHALTELDAAGLLDGTLDEAMRANRESRRSFMKKAAIAGVVPAIVSTSAPAAAQTWSGVVCCTMESGCPSSATVGAPCCYALTDDITGNTTWLSGTIAHLGPPSDGATRLPLHMTIAEVPDTNRARRRPVITLQ